jgi:hypothetical protein
LFNRKVVLIAIFGTLLAVFWQELNLYFLNNQFPYHHGLITCADEASYLRPPQNLLDIGIWKDSSNGITSYFLRPPGFGLYYLFLKLIFGTNVWIGMKIAQILCYFFSIIIISKTLTLFYFKEKINFIVTSFFAFTPCFSGFMYFTITESISPFFMLLSTYLWLRLVKHENENPILFALCSAFLILIRPQLLVFTLLYILFLAFKRRKKQFLLSLIAFLPLIIWNIRTVSISKEWMGIHPIYSNTNNSLYRPSHKKMTNLFRIWEHDGEKFHTTVGILAFETSANYLKKALQNVPIKYHNKVTPIFKEFHELKKYQHTKLSQTKILKGEFKGEQEFYSKIDKSILELKSENKLDYYILTPFKSLKKLLISSHLNLNIFQAQFRGNVFMELLRYFCVFLIVSIFSTCCISIFLRKIDTVKIISFGVFISLFYLSFVQRLNEERYLTPIIPLAFLVLVIFLDKLSLHKIKQ